MERMHPLHGTWPIVGSLILLVLFTQRSRAQTEHHTGVQVRASGGIALASFPELSDLAESFHAAYQSPGVTPSVGLSAIVWASDKVGVTVALEYDWLKTTYQWEPEHPDYPLTGWEIQGFTALVGAEYWLPVSWTLGTPFLGLSAGACGGQIKRFYNDALAERDPRLHDLDNAHSYALDARLGLAVPISGNLALLVSAEYRRTGNLWTLDAGKTGRIEMYVSGFKFLLSVQI